MPKFKLEYSKILYETFEESYIEADNILEAKNVARGLVTEKQRGMMDVEINVEVTEAKEAVERVESAKRSKFPDVPF